MSEQQELQFGEVVFCGPWQVPYQAKRVLCSDGKRRHAFNLRTPDTYFSLPASVKVKGKTVTGYLTTGETDGNRDVFFRSYTYGKNGGMLP